MDKKEIVEILDFLNRHDLDKEIYWSVKDGEPLFYFLCNDFFFWGCADAENVTVENLPILEQCIEELKKLDHEDWVGMLYCAKARGMRPQGACYPIIPKEIQHLFNECGPKREVDIGNPKDQDEFSE